MGKQEEMMLYAIVIFLGASMLVLGYSLCIARDTADELRSAVREHFLTKTSPA